MLEKHELGNTGILVSCLGLGTVKFGRNKGVRYPAGFELPDDRSLSDLLATARDLGVNLIDTAPAYGTSEQRLGTLLKERDKWILCSKAGEEFDGLKSRFDFSAAAIRQSVERSLGRIGTDYLDILLIHSDGSDLDIIGQSDCFSSLQKLKERGLVRAYGMSTKTVAGGMLALELGDLVMVACNPQAADDIPVIQRAGELRKGVLIKKALASGHLEKTSGLDPVLENFKFIFRQGAVSSIIVGTLNPDHLRHNAECATKALQLTRC